MKQLSSPLDAIPSAGTPATPTTPSRWLETPRTRWQLRYGFPLLCWRMRSNDKAIYLSFDDGPSTGITEPILDCLQYYHAKASFFCLGDAIEKSPKTVERMVRQGHSVGNHSYSHLSGWRCSVRSYLADIARCDDLLPKPSNGGLPIFRPPYGELGVVQGLILLLNRRVVMWDVNSMDYRSDSTPSEISERVCEFARPGSIVLMHDSLDAGPRTIEALPSILETLGKRGFEFKAISNWCSIRSKFQ